MDSTDKRILPVNIEDEMQGAYLEYAMSVIVGRALPDVRDGLKPVHRRILFAMKELGNTPDKPYKKSARIVGDVIGKYHPHGDQAVYDTLVRMAQDFSLRYPLVDGQGNFGSIDGDGAAAMRYTEVRLGATAGELLEDLDKDTVEFVPNYDGQQLEPAVLPTRIPNLLVNGSSGIAVGMSTNIPPHNMTEVVDACLRMIDQPTTSIQDLCQIVKGPDFPTGGTIVGTQGILQAYHKGHGVIRIQGKAEIETYDRKDSARERIVITELPYQVNKAKLIEHIAELVREKQIEGISDIRDESARNTIRVVVELKRDAPSNVLLNQLIKFTNLKVSYSLQMIAIDGQRPRLMNLKEIIQCFIAHRRDVVTRRTLYDLRQCEDKAHILEGLLRALEAIDAVIALIRAADSPVVAKEQLQQQFQFSDRQAQAILEMRLQRLTGLERSKVETDLSELKKRIEDLRLVLSSENELMRVIRKELEEVKAQYGDKRRTEIVVAEGEELSLEDLTEDFPVVVTFSHEGFVKRMPTSEFQAQNRGGKGIFGTQSSDQDFITQLYSARTHSHILCLTSFGRIYDLRVYSIPEGSRTARGKNIVNLVQLNSGEKVQDLIPIHEFLESDYLVLLTKKGNIKKTLMSEFESMRVGGKYAITLQGDDDALVGSRIVRAGQDLLICTANGKLIRFSEEEVRATGPTSQGVRGITLSEGDTVVGLEVCDDTCNLLTITEHGYGKQTPVSEYRRQGRGGMGIITLKATEKSGRIASVVQVKESDEIMIISSGGKMIRVLVSGISAMGRNTQGVRIMSMNEGESVSAVTKLQENPDAPVHESDPKLH